ncbi:mannose-1-phosphate guanylyltransferase [Eubacterium xylanophilum]|uniref:mannose-1-phosphate guanylyltransferase n=1 Tax=Eubacterium xylanophilum TaxID=39497 RepID=UPI000478A638|nr:mannose-1-phosphate guanylyltransferase [Eubacterium xylanophilum]
MKITVLIMAGGRGERFWPKSRKNLPKQFLSLTDDGTTMIQNTINRVKPLVDVEDIYVVTNRDYKGLAMQQLPEIPEENILCEPVGRNTAPCVGLAAVHIKKKYDDALMIVLPSDHLIMYNAMFLSVLKDACELAEQGENLTTIGITPTYPETGYGYIKFDPDENVGRAYGVEQFVEKPDLATAQAYLQDESYLWNSGMFVWKVSTILKKIEDYMPDMYKGLSNIGEAIGTDSQEIVLEKEFENMQAESIDYGIMEKSDNIFVIPGTFGWDDVGSWLAVGRIRPTNEYGNAVSGNVITVETKNSIIEGSDKLIAAVGLDDVIIVDTDDALLVCKKSSAGDIKKVLENLKICNRREYI